MEKELQSFFGSSVFNKKVMKAMLSEEAYRGIEKTIDERKELNIEVANEVAKAMKDWAMSKGATHFTHWFQPLTGITAEKHDGFISRVSDEAIISDFSGKDLIKGEPDASSFPSGGLRSTFEARGYTAWDPTSFAFIKGKTLFIPTAFCSFTGEALDKKTPLLKSMEALNEQALRVTKLLGVKAKRITPMVGPEQEYFLIDKEVFGKRKDLMLCGRTLFGAPAPKGQQLDDHYFGIIKPRVQSFMEDLNEALWKLGVPAKTEHNEVAPAQHELAPIYESCNIATDHNQLTMEIMKTVAQNHDLVCLLNEKPFAGVNGSGKHNNWSLSTDTGINLLSPGHTPEEHLRFYLFLTAVIKAVDEYQDLIRISVATASNDNRLGANEAPPAIVSVFLGEELTSSLLAVSEEICKTDAKKKYLDLGVAAIPTFVKDSTDRNRTSPFAFTGNKFELRMLGSSNSIADSNIVLNSAVATVLKEFADELEKDSSNKSIINLVNREVAAHKRIIFNGNGYGEEWVEEAAKRGLLNLRSTPDCLPYIIEKKNVDMLTSIDVFTTAEIYSRYTIQLESYCESMLIETRTMIEMVNEDYLPAISAYGGKLAKTAIDKKQVSSSIPCDYEERTLEKLSTLLKEAKELTDKIEEAIGSTKFESIAEKAMFIKDTVIPLQEKLRSKIDACERICPESSWPYPGYGKIMFSVI
ncbi:MAG: glutamine synthetase III [Bacilli bacterium]|nr:glutamine synthetase III [Bacilli bacterium]